MLEDSYIWVALAITPFVPILYLLSKGRYYKLALMLSYWLATGAILVAAFADATPEDAYILYYMAIPILLSSLFSPLKVAITGLLGNLLLMTLVASVRPALTFGKLVATSGQFVALSGIGFILAAQYRNRIENQKHRQLMESEERYRTLFESSFGGLAVVRNNRILEANDDLAQMFGVDTAYLQDRHLSELFVDIPVEDSEVESSGDLSGSIELAGKRPDRKPLFVEMVMREQTGYAHSPQLLAVRDITVRKQAEAERKQHLSEFSALTQLSEQLRQIDSAPDLLPVILNHMVWATKSHDGVIFLIDAERSQASYFTQFQENGEMNRDVHSLPENFFQHVAAIESVMISTSPNQEPILAGFPEHGDLQAEYESVAFTPLHAKSKTIGLVCVAKRRGYAFRPEDVKLLSALGSVAASALQRGQLLETLEQTVAERTRNLETAVARLKSLDEIKSRLITDVSHALRTPVTTISLYLDLLKQGKAEKRDQYLHIMRETAVAFEIKDTGIGIPLPEQQYLFDRFIRGEAGSQPNPFT
ncbi:MAG: GAF domain-containing protein [Anaerolineae bacterium]